MWDLYGLSGGSNEGLELKRDATCMAKEIVNVWNWKSITTNTAYLIIEIEVIGFIFVW